MALFVDIILGQCQPKLKENQDVDRIAELSTSGIDEMNKIKELYRAISEIPETEKEKNVRERQKVEEEWKAMGEISEVQSANQTGQPGSVGI